MGSNTKIEWCDCTFNPWIGCTKVSPGCANCYAEAMDHRWGNKRWGVSAERHRTSPANWRQPPKWNRLGQVDGRRRRVFCASLADVFDAEVVHEWRMDLFHLIDATPNLDWLLLTKRPGLALRFFDGPGAGFRDQANRWHGVSVEDQERADERIPLLVKTPAAVRFLSCEPLLEGLELRRWLCSRACGHDGPDQEIHWVIVGGESGHGARPMELSWARSIVRQCLDTATPCFVKQLGAKPFVWRNGEDRPQLEGETIAPLDKPHWLNFADRKGGDPTEWPPELSVREFPGSKSKPQISSRLPPTHLNDLFPGRP